MSNPFASLFESLIVRDDDAIRAEIPRLAREEGEEAALLSVTGFAVLGFTPSQHGKHALLACVAAFDLLERFPPLSAEILTECAIYVGQSRPPWTEPPVFNEPAPDPAFTDPARLHEALASSDLETAERWLVSVRERDDFAALFFEAASSFLDDLGHGLIVAAAVWRLAARFPPERRFGILRTALVEWGSAGRGSREKGDSDAESGDGIRDEQSPRAFERAERARLAGVLLEAFIAGDGDIVSFHHVALYDALLTAIEAGADPSLFDRVRPFLDLGEVSSSSRSHDREAPAGIGGVEMEPVSPVYPYARDYAATLQSFSIADRMRRRFPSIEWDVLPRLAKYNLETSAAFDEWNFA
ncbi:MAG: hypothetical protein WBX15_00495 [Thermoanaerobaculia bacterium]